MMRQRALIYGEIAGIPTVTFMTPACAKMSSNVFDGKEKARLVPVTLPRLKFIHGDRKTEIEIDGEEHGAQGQLCGDGEEIVSKG